MSEWCQNRFEITGKSVCIDVLLVSDSSEPY